MTEPNLPAVTSDVSYEVALDPEPPREVALVEPPEPAGHLLPVVPPNWQTLAGARAELARHRGRLAHRARYHGLRSPRYFGEALLWALAGVFLVLRRQMRWWWRAEVHPLLGEAVERGDSREARSLKRDVKETRRFRGYVLLTEVLVLAVGGSVMWFFAPWWGWVLLALVAYVLLARAGKPVNHRIVQPAVVTPRFRRLSADIVLRAYYAAGLGHPDKPDQQVMFGSPMARDGEGSRVLVDLPYGKTLKHATEKRDEIASGLDVQVSQVFLHRDPTSTRRHTLWVADRDPLAVPVGKTPLLACKATDIWKKAPLGLDERGQLVQFLLLWHSILVGGMPRQGKSWTSRLLALFAALDPFVMMDVFDAGGKPDWRKFALVANSCAFGLTPTRAGKPPEILLSTLMSLKEEVEQRYARLSELPTSVCPEGKLTREIARDRRFRMPVRLLVLGEVQEYFLLGEISKAIAELLVYLVKVAPGAGVIVLSDTQRPSGIGQGYMGTQFVNFRDQHQIRFALKTPSWGVSDLVLGDGAYSAGLDSSTLLEEYKGVGILRNAMNASPTVRCFYANDPDAERILTAARALRERAGTLSGMALGEEMPTVARDVLGDVLAVFSGDSGLHWPVLAARLAKRFPERYEDATPESVSADLRALGVPSVPVKMFGQALRGCRREDVERAARG